MDLIDKNASTFFENVAQIIERARAHVGRTADMTMCVTNFEIGRLIVEQEQGGKDRAKYGRGLLKELSSFLRARVGRGFSETNLRNARKFYRIYAPSIQQLITAKLENGTESQIQQLITAESEKSQSLSELLDNPEKSYHLTDFFKVSWTHYIALMRIDNEDERRFYEIETIKNNWAVEDLKREYNSSLYERLALSRDKDEVMRLSKEGQIVEKPQDILKNPLVLEFLGMEEHPSYSETDLESAIISKTQKFMLELGKGFLYEARQKRFSFDEKSFYVDLVFYNRLLQCYVLIDLKVTELKHQDLGQMLMYVNYFDRYVKTDKENPTVGILLCREQNDNIVELTLPEDSNIYASKYSLYLPDKGLLQQKLAEWVEEFEEVQSLLNGSGGDKIG